MPKKKNSSKKNKSPLITILFVVALVTVFYLAGQVQDKDRQLKELRNNNKTSTSGNKQAEGSTVFNKQISTKEQEAAARKQIKDNLEALVGKKPFMAAGKWVLSDIKFKDNGTVTLFYEDGHEAGEVTYKINDPSNYTTWKKDANK